MVNFNRKKIAALFLVLLLALPLLQFNALAADASAKLAIVHVNDRHGRTQADPYVSQIAKDMAAKGKNVLILDAGDSIHGQTSTNLTKGETMAEVMNAVGYSAMTTGNHDFNFGVDRLKEITKIMNFPVLAANVKQNGENLFESYKVFKMEGMTVGVFGLATPETVTKSDPRIVAGLVFEDPAQTAADMVEKLKAEDCDVIIALAHLGVDAGTKPSERSEALAAVDGIDVVIDGHSHTLLENGRTVNGVLIAQTGAFAENIGIVEVTLSDGSITKTARTVALPKEDEETTLVADESIVAKIAEAEAQVEPITSEVVGYTPVLLQGDREFVRVGETNLSDMISDSMRYATGADIAFLTGGNIRASIEAGDITMGQVLTTLPFSNLLATVELTGAEMLEALEHGVSKYPEPVGQNIQVSGIRFEFNPEAEPMHRVTKVTMADGSAFDNNKTYTVCTIDFITAGGDGYEVMEKARNKIYYQGDVDAFVEYLQTDPKITAESDNRVIAVSAAPVETTAGPEESVPAPTPAETVQTPPPPAQPTQPAQPSAPNVYIVQKGDNLTRIANRYGITWRELHKLNSYIKNPNLIYPGQELIVPAALPNAS